MRIRTSLLHNNQIIYVDVEYEEDDDVFDPISDGIDIDAITLIKATIAGTKNIKDDSLDLEELYEDDEFMSSLVDEISRQIDRQLFGSDDEDENDESYTNEVYESEDI